MISLAALTEGNTILANGDIVSRMIVSWLSFCILFFGIAYMR